MRKTESEFQRFDAVVGKLLAVSREELQRRVEAFEFAKAAVLRMKLED
jgi:hypothetical protein